MATPRKATIYTNVVSLDARPLPAITRAIVLYAGVCGTSNDTRANGEIVVGLTSGAVASRFSVSSHAGHSGDPPCDMG